MFESHDEQRAFELWAFGRSPMEYDYNVFMEWNSKHGDKLWMKPDDTLQVSCRQMKKIWKEERHDGPTETMGAKP